MNNDKLTEIAFDDFQKAFYVIGHNLLLKKLSGYGASADRMAWFQ